MEKTWKPTVAGILNIVSGALSLVMLAFVVIGVSVFMIAEGTHMPGYMPAMGPGLLSTAIAMPVLIADVLAIVGGIYALKRKIWGLALAGSIAALFASWPLGIAAIVFTVMSQKEFE